MIVTRCSFGHQDAITALDSLSRERCVTAGGRDRSVRVWKIAEESQLVFHGHEWVSICLSSGDSVSHCLHCWVQMFIYCQSRTKTQWDTLFSWRILKLSSMEVLLFKCEIKKHCLYLHYQWRLKTILKSWELIKQSWCFSSTFTIDTLLLIFYTVYWFIHLMIFQHAK